MKERHWTSLVTSIRHGQTVLVLGPEVAANVAAPATGGEVGAEAQVDALQRQLTSELEEEGQRVSGNTLAAVAQQYEDNKELGVNTLRAVAAKFYSSPTYVPGDAHRALATLPFSLVLTIGHDDLLERALQAAEKRPLSHRYHLRGDKHDNPELVLPGSPDSPVIYHLFGHAREPSSLVLSENDVLDFLIAIASERPPLPSSLVRALKRSGQSFLFVGFGIRQWYPRLLLKVLLRAFDLHRTGSAIAAEPLRGLTEADREQTVLFYQRGMRIDVQDTDVVTFLAELTARVQAAGAYAGSVGALGQQPRVFISYASEDGGLAGQVAHQLQRSHFSPWLDRNDLRGGELWDRRIEEELDSADFVLLLDTLAFRRKTDSYVNKELWYARERAKKVRGAFLIPLEAVPDPRGRVPELRDYQAMPLNVASLEADMTQVISTMRREYQRRQR